MSLLSPPPLKSPFDTGDGPSKAWIDWATELYRYARKYRGSDTTANRPTLALKAGDWYFDSTVGRPIWWSGTAWVYADGTSA